MVLRSLWKLLALLCHAVTRDEHVACTPFEVAQRLNIPSSGLTCKVCAETVTAIMMHKLGFKEEMATIYRLLEPMGIPTTYTESLDVVGSMLPKDMKSVWKKTHKMVGSLKLMLHILIQMQVDGFKNYLVGETATSMGGLPSSRRRKGHESTQDSSGDQSAGRQRALKTQHVAQDEATPDGADAGSYGGDSDSFIVYSEGSSCVVEDRLSAHEACSNKSFLSLSPSANQEHNSSHPSPPGALQPSPGNMLAGDVVMEGWTPPLGSPEEVAFSPASGVVFSPQCDSLEGGSSVGSTRGNNMARHLSDPTRRRAIDFGRSQTSQMSQDATQVFSRSNGDGSVACEYTGGIASEGLEEGDAARPEPEGYERPELPPINPMKKESVWVDRARELGFVLAKGSSMEHVAAIMDVRWDSEHPLPEDPVAAKKRRDHVWHKNYRRVIKQIKIEKNDQRHVCDVDRFIRQELERLATSMQIPAQVVQSYTVEQLRQIVHEHAQPEPRGAVPPQILPDPDDVDIELLSRQPLGANYEVPGKAPISPQQQEDVDEGRALFKNECFERHLAKLDAVQWAMCANCAESKLAFKEYGKRKGTNEQWCQRCLRGTQSKNPDTVFPYMYYSKENLAHFSPVPPELSDLSDVEAMLIARIAPVFRIQVLKGGVTKSCGNVIAFCNDQAPLKSVLPRLPNELEYVFVRRAAERHSTGQKLFQVRRTKVRNALMWLKANNPFYEFITISEARLSLLGEDANVEQEMLQTKFIPMHETPGHREDVVDDLGPAPEQHGAREELDLEEGAVLDPGGPGDAEQTLFNSVREALEPGISEKIDRAGRAAACNAHDLSRAEAEREMVRREREMLRRERQMDNGDAVPGSRANPLNWELDIDTKVNERTPGYWSMAFPTLIPDGIGEFNMSRSFAFSCLSAWAKHCLWWHDGRFAKHPYFKFVAMNIIQRQQAQKQSSFFVGARMGENAPSVGELKDRVAQGDTSVLRTCISYAANIKGTSPYWYRRKQELQALVKFMVWRGSGLPSFFLTGSCAEFHWTPLIKLLQELLRANGDPMDIVNNLQNRRKVVKQYSNVVCQFFHMKTESFIKDVLEPVYGVVDYYLRYEYAESRGQIHFHMLGYRMDGKPHGMLQQGVARGGQMDRAKWEVEVGKWFEDLGFTCQHPGGDDKELWAPPEGDMYPEDCCLEKDYRVCGQDRMHRCHVVNKTMLHCCNKYCLRKQGGQCMCRSGFGLKEDMEEVKGATGTWFKGKKRIRNIFGITQDAKGYLVGEMPRNHPRMIQHIAEFPALWGGNGDETVIISASDPQNPDPREMNRSVCYTTGYICKNGDTVNGTLDVYKAVLRGQDEEDDDLPINKTVVQCMNKSVGRQEVSGPAAASFLAQHPLYRCTRDFVSLSLGSHRRIYPQQKKAAEDEGCEDGGGGQNGGCAVGKNLVDKYKDAVTQGDTVVTLDGVVPVSRISLYAWASGPHVRRAIGSMCPVPSGANTEATWPVTPTYARAMMMLHKPGFIGGDEWTEDDWLRGFEQFRASAQCHPMVNGEVEAAKDRWQKCNDGVPDFSDSEVVSDSSVGGECDYSENDWCDVVDTHTGGGNAGERDESELYRGIGDGTEWGAAAEFPEIHPMESWAEFKPLLRPKEIPTRAPESAVTGTELDRLTEGQRAAVALILQKMLEIYECGQSAEALAKVEPLRVIVAGSAGTGKTKVIEIISAFAWRLFGPGGMRNVAPSGTAAFLMRGTTLHSLFPIPMGPAQYQGFRSPTGERLRRLQADLLKLVCLCVDERSMVGTVVMGWMEYLLRIGMNKGAQSREPYGGLKILVVFGDDSQLPPVMSTRLFSKKAQSSEAGRQGALLYREIRDCVFLTGVVRQTGEPCFTCKGRWHEPGEQCSRLRDLLLRVRYGQSPAMAEHGPVTAEDLEWLRDRELFRLSPEERERFEKSRHKTVWIMPKNQAVAERNWEQLVKLSRGSAHEVGAPVVKCAAYDHGPCSKRKMKRGKGEYEFGQLPRRTYLAKGAPVMLTTNLHVPWGLFNGSLGTVRDIYFGNGRQPSLDGKQLPDVVFVEFPAYEGPAQIPGHPTVVPIGPWLFEEHCKHECSRLQYPLRLAWAITVHKSQGMTVGPEKQIKQIVLDLGGKDTEKWSAGSSFVQLSRATEIGALAISGTVDGERFLGRGDKAKEVAEEDARLLRLYERTKQRCTQELESGPLCWLTHIGEFRALCDTALDPDGGQSFWGDGCDSEADCEDPGDDHDGGGGCGGDWGGVDE